MSQVAKTFTQLMFYYEEYSELHHVALFKLFDEKKKIKSNSTSATPRRLNALMRDGLVYFDVKEELYELTTLGTLVVAVVLDKVITVSPYKPLRSL